jgi:hypothetical protein
LAPPSVPTTVDGEDPPPPPGPGITYDPEKPVPVHAPPENSVPVIDAAPVYILLFVVVPKIALIHWPPSETFVEPDPPPEAPKKVDSEPNVVSEPGLPTVLARPPAPPAPIVIMYVLPGMTETKSTFCNAPPPPPPPDCVDVPPPPPPPPAPQPISIISVTPGGQTQTPDCVKNFLVNLAIISFLNFVQPS